MGWMLGFTTAFGIVILICVLMVPLCIGGVLVANGIRHKRRLQTGIGWFVITAPIAILLYNMGGYTLMPLSVQAGRVMSLPQEADVLSVHPYGGEAAASVVFRLPESKTTSQWLQTVWSLNNLPDHQVVDGNSWQSTDADQTVALTYYPATKQYVYIDSTSD